MAQTAASPTSLAGIQSAAQALFATIQAGGVNASDPGTIVSTGNQLLTLLDQLQPHVNRAVTAFGDTNGNVSAINALRNKIQKVIAAYST